MQRQAKETLVDFRKLQSGTDAQALEVKSFQVDPVYPETPLSVAKQNAEITGLVLKEQNYKYHNAAY